ncbi:hypothetical protein [Sphingomicrobium sediminis]|uniref:Uncharacterized protein n=1 Tax=Sphingomicrobium sediminis TaxID=2950949 RepID=A0A9X2J292_9SPHN|nr:hypothetical protein [Sphingomicrobium sediminis]MCM8557574.1 hypothetical protein [Sphingomicrobium sediminis]
MMRGFASIIWTAGAAGAILACYLVSLQVASSRAELERVEEQIAYVTRDIRKLETEIGTRGRLSQLERWNARFLRLSAPEADQFAANAYVVAAMARPEPTPRLEAPVILAEAERDGLGSPSDLVVQASLTSERTIPTSDEGEGPDAASPDIPLPAASLSEVISDLENGAGKVRASLDTGEGE